MFKSKIVKKCKCYKLELYYYIDLLHVAIECRWILPSNI